MSTLQLAFTEAIGPEGAPLVVLGPSLGTSTILWETTKPLLSRRFRVTCWDLPGHGDSAPAESPFSVGELADAVAAGARNLGDKTFFYAGVSLGGAVGLELLVRHEALVRRAAILASGAKIGDPAAWAERAALVREQSTSALVAGSAQRWFADGSMEREQVLTGRLLHALQGADDESYAKCCEALADYDVRERLAEISVPVLAVWGDEDEVTPEAAAAEIAAGVQNGRSAAVEHAAHLIPAEQPTDVAGLLDQFFGSDE